MYHESVSMPLERLALRGWLFVLCWACFDDASSHKCLGGWAAEHCRQRSWWLYDLAVDRSETVDQSSSEKERYEAISKKWLEVAKDVDKLPETQLKPVSKRLMGNGLQFRQ